jgi:hypothetical protein
VVRQAQPVTGCSCCQAPLLWVSSANGVPFSHLMSFITFAHVSSKQGSCCVVCNTQHIWSLCLLLMSSLTATQLKLLRTSCHTSHLVCHTLSTAPEHSCPTN